MPDIIPLEQVQAFRSIRKLIADSSKNAKSIVKLLKESRKLEIFTNVDGKIVQVIDSKNPFLKYHCLKDGVLIKVSADIRSLGFNSINSDNDLIKKINKSEIMADLIELGFKKVKYDKKGKRLYMI